MCVCVPTGEIVSARVWLEHSGMMDSWHLDTLTVTMLPSQRQWAFTLRDWLPKQGATMQAKASAARHTPVLAHIGTCNTLCNT